MPSLTSAARAPRRPLAVAATGFVALSLLAACGDDSSASTTTTAGVRSQEEWCEVMNEVDEVTNEHPFELGDFAEVQAAYTDGLQLVEQLEAGIEHVDAGARADVSALLQLFEDVAGAVLDSPDRETAAPQVEALFIGQDLHVGPAFDWVTTTCSSA